MNDTNGPMDQVVAQKTAMYDDAPDILQMYVGKGVSGQKQNSRKKSRGGSSGSQPKPWGEVDFDQPIYDFLTLILSI